MKRFAFKKETDSPNGSDWKDANSKRTSTKQILIILVCLCFVCVWGVQAVMQFSQFSKPLGEQPKPAAENITNLPNQIIVFYKPEIVNNRYLSSQVSSTAATQVDALNVTKLQLKNIEGAELVTLPVNSSIESAIGIYLNNPFVLSAEPRYIPAHNDIVPNDPYYSEQWGFRNTGQLVNGISGTSGADIKAQAAWDSTTGSNTVIVAVEDVGVDYNHPDLANNIWTNPSNPGEHGWNFYINSSDVMDYNGHGTHCAGVIGAVGNNGIGVSGTNWNVKIIPTKSRNNAGTSVDTLAVYNSWNYAAEHNASIISNSWSISIDNLLISYGILLNPEVLFVFSAGNGGQDSIGDNNDITNYYPSTYPYDNIIAVAASDQNDNLATWSNYGVTTVDLAAPGVNIVSTYLESDYAIGDGTSMSTPMVAGVAALIKARDPSLNATQIKSVILNNVDTKSSFSNKVVSGGRLNASKAVQAVGSSQPSPNPTVTSITPPSGYNNRSVSITNLAGTNFANGAIVRLTRSGYANITASGVAVAPTKITCTLSLTGTTPGQYNVVVKNLDGKEGVLTNGFTINAGAAGVVGDSIAIFRPSTGYWYFDYNLDGIVDKSFRFGGSTDQIIFGNWQGTGIDGIAIFRPSTGYWYFDYNLDGIVDKSFRYGGVGDRIAKGNWSGNGRDGIAIFRPSTGYWYLDYNLDGIVDKTFRYGGSTDQVFAGKWA